MLNSNQQLLEVKWPELLFCAESTNEDFRDVRIITAASKYVDIAYKVALSEPTMGDTTSTNELRTIVAAVINAQTHSVREYVDIRRKGMWVCIDTVVIDDNATLRALSMVAEAMDQLNGKEGRIYFGEELKFTTVDTPWLF